MAYRLLSLTAISGEFPTDQLNRLPGSPYYLESVVTALKKDGLLRTYYRDKLRGYRLGPRAKATLLESRPDRFASYLTGDTDTNRLKCEIDRRLRLHRLAETYVTMDNAGVCVYRDEKPAIFAPEGYAGGTAKKLLDMAMQLEGMPRHASTHAAGVLISEGPNLCRCVLHPAG